MKKKKEITLEHIAESINLLSQDFKAGYSVLKYDNYRLKIELNFLQLDVKQLKNNVGILQLDVDKLKTDVAEIKDDVKLVKLDITQLKKDYSRLDERTLDVQEDIHIIIDILKNRDNRIGLLELAIAPTPH